MSIDERVAMLERELNRSRRLNRLFVLAAVCLGVGLWFVPPLASQEAKEPKTIRAGRFELLDEQGRVRGVLGMHETSPMLLLSDEKQQARCSVAAGRDASLLILTPPSQKGRQSLVAGSEGSVISLEDGNGRSRLEISLLRDAPEVWLSDADQSGRAILRVGKDGPLMRLIENKNEIWSTRK